MIILDVEIKKAILGRGETPIEGIEYCRVWRDFAGMGISCVCTYDITTHLSRVFLEEDLAELATYLHGKPTAGFNTKRFDLPLLARYGVEASPEVVSTAGEHYDILEEIWIALGLNPNKFNPRTHGGWGLDAVGQATLGIAKTRNGMLAPVWWQQGRRGKVIDYCLNDVWMEGSLLLHIMRNGGIVTNGRDTVRVRLPPLSKAMEGALLPMEGALLPPLGLRRSIDGDLPIGRQYGAAQAKAFSAMGKNYEEQAVAPLNTAPPECPESRYDIGGWHAWGSNGFCRDCGAPKPPDAQVPSDLSPSGLGIIR